MSQRANVILFHKQNHWFGRLEYFLLRLFITCI